MYKTIFLLLSVCFSSSQDLANERNPLINDKITSIVSNDLPKLPDGIQNTETKLLLEKLDKLVYQKMNTLLDKRETSEASSMNKNVIQTLEIAESLYEQLLDVEENEKKEIIDKLKTHMKAVSKYLLNKYEDKASESEKDMFMDQFKLKLEKLKSNIANFQTQHEFYTHCTLFVMQCQNILLKHIVKVNEQNLLRTIQALNDQKKDQNPSKVQINLNSSSGNSLVLTSLEMPNFNFKPEGNVVASGEFPNSYRAMMSENYKELQKDYIKRDLPVLATSKLVVDNEINKDKPKKMEEAVVKDEENKNTKEDKPESSEAKKQETEDEVDTNKLENKKSDQKEAVNEDKIDYLGMTISR